MKSKLGGGREAHKKRQGTAVSVLLIVASPAVPVSACRHVLRSSVGSTLSAGRRRSCTGIRLYQQRRHSRIARCVAPWRASTEERGSRRREWGEENGNREGLRGGTHTDSGLLLRRTLQNGRRGVTRSKSQRKRRRLQGQAGDNGSCGGGGGGCCCFAGTALSDGVWLSGWRLNLPRGASARSLPTVRWSQNGPLTFS